MTRATIAVIYVCLAVGGCATQTAAPAVVVTDTFCISPASKKRTWNPDIDTIETMREAVTHNRYVDLRCRAGAVKG